MPSVVHIVALLMALTSRAMFAADIVVDGTTVDGTSLRGTLTAWSTDGLTLQGESAAVTQPLSSWQVLVFPEHRRLPPPKAWVLLATGDRLAAQVTQATAEVVTANWLRAPRRDPLQLPLTSVAAIVLDVPAVPRMQRDLFAAIRHISTGNDALALKTGERLQGEFQQLEGGLLSVRTSLGESRLEADRVRWVAFDPDLADPPKLPAEYWIVQTIDGSRFTARNIRPDLQQRLQCELLVGGKVAIPWQELTRLEQLGTDVVPLSSRQPRQVTVTPFLRDGLTESAGWVRDGNATGSPLSVRGTEFPHGIGVRSRTVLIYQLEPGDRSFRTHVGIDDAAEGQGHVVFSIVVDDQRVWESGSIGGLSPLLLAPAIDLAGKTLLTLTVEFGEAADIADLANWCSPVIVRGP